MIAICIANGPSLTKEDVEYCQGKGKIYVVKESVFLAPWADVLYAADGDWWPRYDLSWFNGRKVSVSASTDIEVLEYKTNIPWSDTPGLLATGGNSGFQAVNLAELEGATKIILLGYDMGFTGKKHWWTGQYKRQSRNSRYDEWLKRWDQAKPHIKAEVINCTPGGYLETFERANLRDVI